MDRGLYIAASGMLAEMARQDLLANDLANVSTSGYKADRVSQRSFSEVMLENTSTGQQIGPVGSGSAIARQVTDLTGAPVKDTGEPLDFGITGDGFFAVRTAQGTRYTRNGSFQTAGNGNLVDQLGNPVLSQNGQTIRVAGDGSVPAASLGLFNLNTPRKIGDGMFSGTPAGRGTGTVKSGALEGSGVDPPHTMVDMMASMRAYESGQKVIQTIDQTLDKAATQVGSVS
jgi:flagellar basal-body rod protein FlgF